MLLGLDTVACRVVCGVNSESLMIPCAARASGGHGHRYYSALQSPVFASGRSDAAEQTDGGEYYILSTPIYALQVSAPNVRSLFTLTNSPVTKYKGP